MMEMTHLFGDFEPHVSQHSRCPVCCRSMGADYSSRRTSSELPHTCDPITQFYRPCHTVVKNGVHFSLPTSPPAVALWPSKMNSMGSSLLMSDAQTFGPQDCYMRYKWWNQSLIRFITSSLEPLLGPCLSP